MKSPTILQLLPAAWLAPAVCAIAFSSHPVPARAAGDPDSPSIGTIQGRVVAVGREIAFANVIVIGTRRGAATDEHGRFRIVGIPPGLYPLRILPFGQDPVTIGVRVTAGSDTTMVIPIPLSQRSEGVGWPRYPLRAHPVANCDSAAHPWGARDPALRVAALPDTTGWWTASGSNFDFSLPREFRRTRGMGIDSEVKEWIADSARITYDMGSYTGCAQPGGEAGAEVECLGGLTAWVRLSARQGQFDVSACFPDLGLGLYGSAPDAATRTRVLCALRTIRFHAQGAPALLTGPPPPLVPSPRHDLPRGK